MNAKLNKVAVTSSMKILSRILKRREEEGIEQFFNQAAGFSKNYSIGRYTTGVHDMYQQQPHIRKMINDLITETHPRCLDKFLVNFIGHHNWFGWEQRQKIGAQLDTHIPYVGLISPSMRCNLRCTGCYAADYPKKDDMTFEDVDRMVSEMRDLGIYFVIVLGGEPFFNDYMLDIYQKYNDMYFMPFTNGTLFTESLADKLQKLGNVMTMFSLEGFEGETDSRRGPGTFTSVMNGMKLLKDRGVLFGVSSATSNLNVDTVTSDRFIDMVTDAGSRMNWYFMFMPVGEDPIGDMNLMLNPKERLMLGERVREIRSSRSYFTIDFFNDAPYVGGCIAGREYFHINSKMDLEPCIFAHFSTDNLKEKTLLEGLSSPFFKALRKRQPHNDNLLMPCMMIDNPEVIREVAKDHHIRPTHASAVKMLTDTNFQHELDMLSDALAPEADQAWEQLEAQRAKKVMTHV